MSQEARDYLSKISAADRLINRLHSTIATLRSSLTSQNYELNPDKVQSSGAKDALGDTIAKIVDLEAEIDQHIDELVEMKKNTYHLIKKIPDLDQQNVLIARYIQGMEWDDLSDDLNFSIAQVYRIHGSALIEFAQKNPDILKDDSK